MAKDLNTSNLSVVNAHGARRVMAGETESRSLVQSTWMESGSRGSIREVRSGELVGLGVDGDTQVPAGPKERDAFLKKWSSAAKKASKANKAGERVSLTALPCCMWWWRR